MEEGNREEREQRREGGQTEALAAETGGEEQPRGVSNVRQNISLACTDLGVGEFAAVVSATTSSAAVYPAKFSSFPQAFIAPAPVSRRAPSLFPSSGIVQHGAPSWLSNSSFSENLLPPPPSVSTTKATEHLYGKEGVSDETEKREESKRTESSSSDSQSEAEEKSRQKRQRKKLDKKEKKKEEQKKRRKQRKHETGDAIKQNYGSLEGQSVDRKSVVKSWADRTTLNVKEEYYVDTRGDRDNLAFASLYRMDVARYFRQQIGGGEREGMTKRNATHLEVPESDGNMQENNNTYRYWFTALELSRDFRGIRIRPLRPSATINRQQLDQAFIPLGSTEINKKGEGEEEGESWNDYIVRRTREFNTLTREKPDDENSWLEFAKFQDGLVQMAQRKGAKKQAVEKKISVLEKALEHHPGSVPLMLAYLEACSLRDTVPEMLEKWEKAVISMWGSYRFWKEFVLFVCSQFSLFSVGTVRAIYIRALGALTAARDQVKNEDERDTTTALRKSAELAMVSILADRCRFEVQTGHAELGLGIFQATMEYSLFAPLIQTSENNKRRLFEAFWDSQALRIGEEGALGWALWLEKEEEQYERAQAHEAAQDEQAQGGWTGWSEPVSLRSDPNTVEDDENADAGNNKKGRNSSNSEEGDAGDEEEEGVESDDDEATLLAKLGLLSSMDAGKELEVTDPGVWLRWAAEEKKRSCEQWLPIHGQTEQQDELERVVMFEDIRSTLVSIYSEEALCWLIGHFFEFCNLPFSNWCCSNDFSSQQGIEGLESLTDSLSRLRGIRSTGSNKSQYVVVGNNREKSQQQVRPGEIVLKSLVGDPKWFLNSLSRSQFVCNALLLLQSSSFNSLARRHWDLTETLLVTECLASDHGLKASRHLAKKLLKTHRQDIALWTAYALVEGATGHMETARKVFDTTLASLGALPNELQDDATLIYLACADMEMSHGSKTRALYVLCHLGAGMPYAPDSPSDVEDVRISPALLLKAKVGFQQHLQNVCRGRTKYNNNIGNRAPIFGVLDERAVAVIACVGLFEELTSGWEAAVCVFEQSLAFSLPGKWKESKELEAVMERYVGLLRRSTPIAKPARVRRSAMRGLTVYPHNSVLLEMFVQSSSSTYNLRRYFDASVKRNPSTLLWMFSLATELGNNEENAARIRSLFERALEMKATQHSVVLWRAYLAYEYEINQDIESVRRIYFRAIHACPWSKKLWLDGFTMLSSVLTAQQLAEFQEIIRDKELRICTDVYEILLQGTEDDS